MESWIDFHADLSLARELAASDLSLQELVQTVYARRGWDTRRVELRTRQVMEGTGRLERDLGSWLTPLLHPNDLLLDLGCGTGVLLAAAQRHGWNGIGIDVSMTWLVVAKRMIEASGGVPVLAAALGEALPLRDAAVDLVISLDVIEHVRSPENFLTEIDRTTRAGGRVVMTTPNRLSLTAEPHVGVWGVGWLPRSLQKEFVRWRSGKSYDDTQLFSIFGLMKMLRRHTSFRINVVTPPAPREEIARFPPVKAKLAITYNRVCNAAFFRPLLLVFAPFFRIEGTKE